MFKFFQKKTKTAEDKKTNSDNNHSSDAIKDMADFETFKEECNNTLKLIRSCYQKMQEELLNHVQNSIEDKTFSQDNKRELDLSSHDFAIHTNSDIGEIKIELYAEKQQSDSSDDEVASISGSESSHSRHSFDSDDGKASLSYSSSKSPKAKLSIIDMTELTEDDYEEKSPDPQIEGIKEAMKAFKTKGNEIKTNFDQYKLSIRNAETLRQSKIFYDNQIKKLKKNSESLTEEKPSKEAKKALKKQYKEYIKNLEAQKKDIPDSLKRSREKIISDLETLHQESLILLQKIKHITDPKYKFHALNPKEVLEKYLHGIAIPDLSNLANKREIKRNHSFAFTNPKNNTRIQRRNSEVIQPKY